MKLGKRQNEKLLLILLCLPILFSCGAEKKQDNDLTRENLKGKIKEMTIYVFNVRESFGELEKGNLMWKNKCKYDEDGNKTEERYYKDGKLIWKEKYKDGNKTETNYYNKDGEPKEKQKNKYDKVGNKTETNYYNKDGELEEVEKWKHKYKYDVFNNNWILKTSSDNTITEREIEYYK